MINGFLDNHGLIAVSSLAYALLLSLIPFAIALTVLIYWLPVSQQLASSVQEYIFAYFLPEIGSKIYPYYTQLVAHAKQLSWISSLFLFISAYSITIALAKHLNMIFKAEQKRKLLHSITVYTSFIFIGPLLLSSAVYLQLRTEKYLGAFSEYSHFNYFGSLLLSVMLFTLIYKFLSAKFVALKYALIAGLVAGLAFDSAKLVFIFYANHFFHGNNVLYGSLEVIPLFLMWLHISSLILLFCAQIIVFLDQRHPAH